MLKIEIDTDDGSNLDLKVAELLRKYRLRGTFYIPNCCELTDESIRRLSADFKIGGHTYSHYQDLKQLHDVVLEYEIEENKEWLESLTGKRINRFAYPRGRYNERVMEVVKKAGYGYARTTLVFNLDPPTDMFRVRPTIQVYPFREEYEKKHWLHLAKEYFLRAKETTKYYHLFLHSRDLYKFKMWDSFEELLKFINKNI